MPGTGKGTERRRRPPQVHRVQLLPCRPPLLLQTQKKRCVSQTPVSPVWLSCALVAPLHLHLLPPTTTKTTTATTATVAWMVVIRRRCCCWRWRCGRLTQKGWGSCRYCWGNMSWCCNRTSDRKAGGWGAYCGCLPHSASLSLSLSLSVPLSVSVSVYVSVRIFHVIVPVFMPLLLCDFFWVVARIWCCSIEARVLETAFLCLCLCFL